MKTMKKVLALILSVLIIVSLAVPVVGAGDTPTYSITIENAVDKQTYNAYKIFDAVPAATGTNISYTIDSTSLWFDVVTNFMYLNEGGTAVNDKPEETNGNKADKYEGKGLTLTKIDGGTTYTVVHNNAVFNETAAGELAKYLSSHIPSGAIKYTGKASKSGNTVSATIDVSDGGAGYYFVDTSLGALSSLGTVKGNNAATIEEKNSEPNVVKKVNKDNNVGNDTGDDNAWVSDNDADIGDTVYFQSTITVQKACAENVSLVDKMSEGLSLNKDSIEVYYNNVKVEASTDATTNYTLTTTGLTGGKTFTIDFNNNYIASILSALTGGATETTIIVKYNATLNENAKVGATEGNPNETYLEYGNVADKTSSTSSKTITYTWGFDVLKYTGTEKTPLSDAVFVLSKSSNAPTVNKNDNGTIVSVTGDDVVSFKEVTSTTKYLVAKDGTVNYITTGTTGRFTFEGLESGAYYLHEIKAPDGYNMITEPLTVRIEATNIDDNNIADGTEANTVSMTLDNGTADGVYTDDIVEVENNAGSALPETGGIGTTIFYVVGGIMMVVAIVLLVTKKKMSNKK